MRTKIQFNKLQIGERFYRDLFDEEQCTKTGITVYSKSGNIYFEMVYVETDVYVEEGI